VQFAGAAGTGKAQEWLHLGLFGGIAVALTSKLRVLWTVLESGRQHHSLSCERSASNYLTIRVIHILWNCYVLCVA
jgi:hypothetical protein